MTGIQLILLSGFAFLALYFFTKLRSRIADAVIFLVFVALGVVFVIFPEWTNILAKKLGVGRGADLIFYTSIIAFSFVVMMLYSKVRKMEQTITQIIRNKAKQNATSSKDN